MEDKNEIKLTDFYQAAVLKTAGLNLIRIEKENQRTSIFVFQDYDHKSKEVLDKHWKWKLKLSSRMLIETINELKTRIYSQL